MPGQRKPRSRTRRPRRRQTSRMVKTRVIQYTDGLTFAKFYDNNGTDEQGIFTVFALNSLLPASSTKIGNDYNRPATVTGCKVFIRWANGLNNPPMAVQFEWGWSDNDGQHNYLSAQTRISNVNVTNMYAPAPLALRSRLIDNPSNEKGITVRINFLGRKLVATDAPILEFDLTLKQEKIPIIAHSGNTYALQHTMQTYTQNDTRTTSEYPILPSTPVEN